MKITVECPHCRQMVDVELTPSWMVTASKPPDDIMLQHPDDVCWFSYRVQNILKNHGISTMQKLVSMCERDLLRFPNFGRVSLAEVKDQLAQKGLRLGMDVDAAPPTP